MENYVDIFTVDAFTSLPFRGNPAGVCLLGNITPSDEDLLKISMEMNLSETAFLQKINSNDSFSTSSEFKLRWMTPEVEVPLCGHATLATAAVLFYEIGNQSESLTFNTLSGKLKASRSKSNDLNASNDLITLDFPLNPPEVISKQEKEQLEPLIQTLCDGSVHLVEEVLFNQKTRKLLIRLKNSPHPHKLLSALKPDSREIMRRGGEKIKGVIVTTSNITNQNNNEKKIDFYSRYFAPWLGIDEDPVTGSAHTVLGPYWSQILGKVEMKAMQCSKRSGTLWLQVNPSINRCLISGQAVVVVKGSIRLP